MYLNMSEIKTAYENLIYNDTLKQKFYRARYCKPAKESIKPIKTVNSKIKKCLSHFDIKLEMLTPVNSIEDMVFRFIANENKIRLANLANYKTLISYYTTYFHELTHAIGNQLHPNDFRFGMNRVDYSFEEMVAETGSLLLMKHFKIINKRIPLSSLIYLKVWQENYKEYSDKRTKPNYKNAYNEAVKRVNILLNLIDNK